MLYAVPCVRGGCDRELGGGMPIVVISFAWWALAECYTVVGAGCRGGLQQDSHKRHAMQESHRRYATLGPYRLPYHNKPNLGSCWRWHRPRMGHYLFAGVRQWGCPTAAVGSPGLGMACQQQ